MQKYVNKFYENVPHSIAPFLQFLIFQKIWQEKILGYLKTFTK